MTTERIKIEVASVGSPKKVGDKGSEVTQFRGKDGVTYECWSGTLMEHIKPGATIDADVAHDIKKDKDGNEYPHNKVTQLYIDGKGVRETKGGRWRGGGGGKSPEDIKSIEDQVRAKLITELIIAEKETDGLKHKLYAWLDKLGDKVMPAHAPEKPKAEPKARTKELTPDTAQAVKDAEELFTPDPVESPETAQEGQGEAKSIIDLDWLREKLAIIRSGGDENSTFGEKNLLAYMKKLYKIEVDTVLNAAAMLDQGKATHFTKMVEDALK